MRRELRLPIERPVRFAAAQWPLDRSPYLLETSRPGVFAVGDVRCGNVKRVASALGEGSIAISFVYRVLAELGPSALAPCWPPVHQCISDGIVAEHSAGV